MHQNETYFANTQSVLPRCLSIQIKCHFANNFCKVLISIPFDHKSYQKNDTTNPKHFYFLFPGRIQLLRGTPLEHLQPYSTKHSGVKLLMS